MNGIGQRTGHPGGDLQLDSAIDEPAKEDCDKDHRDRIQQCNHGDDDAGKPKADEFSELRGRSGFAELGRKMQDALMKKTDDNQLKMIALMEAGNAKQDELIKAVRDKPVAQVGLQ